ncbi:MAG: biotin/lipoyl-containing protein [Chloroflexota bacterium]
MDLLLALNITIYGLGIVFLALLVLMFSIMILSKIFAVATGKEVFSATNNNQGQPAPAVQMAGASVAVAAPPTPEVAAAPVPTAAPDVAPVAEVLEQIFAPLPGKVLSVAVKPGDKVKSGDELCVIEAMKMGNSIKAQQDGVVGEVLVSPGQSVSFGAALVTIVREGSAGQPQRAATAAAPAPVAAAPVTAAAAAALAGFKMGVAGTQYQVELKTAPDGSRTVVVDGVPYKVEQDKADRNRYFVNGAAHTVEIKDKGAGGAFVVVDGVAQKVEISGEVYEAPPKSFQLTVAGKQFQVEVKGTIVKVNGSSYQVERDKADSQRFLVNGQPHTVVVKEMAGSTALVEIDGKTETIGVAGLAAANPVASPAKAAPVAAPAPAPVAAPAPAPAAPAAQPAPAAAPAAGETVTAPLPGKVLSVAVKPGDVVKPGDELCVIEAMKMGNSIKAQRAGTIKDVLVSPGQSVGFGAPIVVIA